VVISDSIMKGFILGILAASAVWTAVWTLKFGFPGMSPPVAVSEPVVAAPVATAPKARGRRRGVRPAGKTAGIPDETVQDENEPQPMELSRADLASVARGDDLSALDVVQFDMGDEGGARELQQEDIDLRFRAHQEEILGCIAKARPDDVTYVPGRVTIAFRIRRTGEVKGVRVEAPSILQKNDLLGCVRQIVTRLKFPASAGSQVVTYPFQLS
jgi:hypothetical protein